MNLLLDTNILVYIARAGGADSSIDFVAPGDSNLYISVVSEAEVKSLALRNRWGTNRKNLLNDFFR